MEIRDRQTLDAGAEISSLLATVYQRYRRVRRVETATESASQAVNGELANQPPESPHVHEVET